MAEMRITPQQYEASMRRHGTRDWTAEDNRVTRQYREENAIGEFAPPADEQPAPDVAQRDSGQATEAPRIAPAKAAPRKATGSTADDGK